jgi:hypothetical protein
MDSHTFIASANMPQLGSFGECVFAEACRGLGMTIEPMHSQRHDFRVNGQAVDVKTSRRRLNQEMTTPKLKVQHKIEGIQYAAVEFCKSGALVSREGQILGAPVWTDLESLFHRWKAGEFGKPHTSRSLSNRGLPADVRAAVEAVFKRKGLPSPYILYRSVMFNDESPHNLLPSQRSIRGQRGWTVFLVFSEAPAALDRLTGIIAFPDAADASLPRLAKPRTGNDIPGLQKVDLSLVPSTFRFNSLQDLESAVRDIGLPSICYPLPSTPCNPVTL